MNNNLPAKIDEAKRQIELASTPGEANSVRAKIAAIQELLPEIVKDRQLKRQYAIENGWNYVLASRRAGELWALAENKATQGSGMEKRSKESLNVITTEEVGFKNTMDATVCERISTLDEQDLTLYVDDCETKWKVPTIYGVYQIWRMFNQNRPVPIAGKYGVIYADPPWDYGNTREENAVSMPEHYYQPIRDRDLKELNVGDIADDNAILFLWVTSPKLEECFPVINAWGFKYKTSFVWDKIKHNMGHYNSVRHEFLLVCTKGSYQPEVMKLFDSVQSIERSKHSEKPEKFREIIETLYPSSNKIELFARKDSEGWDIYGNEIS